MTTIQGFPVLTGVNQGRESLFNFSNQDSLSVNSIAAWLGHKALSVICIPCNTTATAVGAVGMAVTGATLGALKVGIFAATLGNVKPSFPSGFLWFGERAAKASSDLVVNTYELLYDVGNLFYQGYRLVKWIAERINLGGFVKMALNAIAEVFKFFIEKILSPMIENVLVPTLEFVVRRIDAGLKKAVESEVPCQINESTPFLIKPMNDIAKETRIDWSSQERLLSTIAKHYAISIVNIPVNAAAAICFTATSILLSVAFVGKASLYAATNVNIAIPTFAGHSIRAAASTSFNTIADVATDAADPFVLIYKTAYTLRLNRVMATALDVLLYIPEAVFS